MNGTLPVLLAADPALPLRDALLDVSAMREPLSALGSGRRASVSECTVARVNYQVGKSLRCVFRIVADDEPHTVAARMFREGRSADAYARAIEGARPCGNLRPVVHLPELSAVFWVFPNDRKIDTLAPLLQNGAAEPIPPVVKNAAARLVAYAPEKSATLVYARDDDRPVAYAKIAAAHQAARDFQTYNSLRAALETGTALLTLPRPLAYSSELRTLWLEAIHGRRLAGSAENAETAETAEKAEAAESAEKAETAANVEDIRRLGAAVATFHGLSVPHAPVFERFAPARLSTEAANIARVRPDAAEAVDHLARRLASTAPADADRSCLHGDLHPKNAIVCGDGLALIDVEDVAIGPSAADIGSLLAALLYLNVGNRLPAATFIRHAVAFLCGYAAVRSLPRIESLTWHTAAALFVERAARAVTRIRPLGLTHLHELIREAGRTLDRGLEL